MGVYLDISFQALVWSAPTLGEPQRPGRAHDPELAPVGEEESIAQHEADRRTHAVLVELLVQVEAGLVTAKGSIRTSRAG